MLTEARDSIIPPEGDNVRPSPAADNTPAKPTADDSPARATSPSRVSRSAPASAQLDAESECITKNQMYYEVPSGPLEARAASQMVLPASPRRDDADPVVPPYA